MNRVITIAAAVTCALMTPAFAQDESQQEKVEFLMRELEELKHRAFAQAEEIMQHVAEVSERGEPVAEEIIGQFEEVRQNAMRVADEIAHGLSEAGEDGGSSIEHLMVNLEEFAHHIYQRAEEAGRHFMGPEPMEHSWRLNFIVEGAPEEFSVTTANEGYVLRSSTADASETQEGGAITSTKHSVGFDVTGSIHPHGEALVVECEGMYSEAYQSKTVENDEDKSTSDSHEFTMEIHASVRLHPGEPRIIAGKGERVVMLVVAPEPEGHEELGPEWEEHEEGEFGEEEEHELEWEEIEERERAEDDD